LSESDETKSIKEEVEIPDGTARIEWRHNRRRFWIDARKISVIVTIVIIVISVIIEAVTILLQRDFGRGLTTESGVAA
jgi:hypothetical protein